MTQTINWLPKIDPYIPIFARKYDHEISLIAIKTCCLSSCDVVRLFIANVDKNKREFNIYCNFCISHKFN